jgi:hypothetical protein
VETARIKLSLADVLIARKGRGESYAEAEALITAARKIFGTQLPPGHKLRWAALYSFRDLYAPDAMNDPQKLAQVQALIAPASTQPRAGAATTPAATRPSEH